VEVVAHHSPFQPQFWFAVVIGTVSHSDLIAKSVQG